MFFTQEDYQKIELYLKLNAKKDTDFLELEENIDANDTVAFVHDGKNYRISILRLASILSSSGEYLNEGGFINMSWEDTEDSGAFKLTKYPSLAEAVANTPMKYRTPGEVIAWTSENNVWQLHQYTGNSADDWEDLSLWKSFNYYTKREIEALLLEAELVDYAKKEWVESKNYLRFHQDISGKADKDETFTKTQVISLIETLKKLDIVPVESIDKLPEASEETRRKLWFVHKTPGESVIKVDVVEETTVTEGTPPSSSTDETTETPTSENTETPTELSTGTEPNQEENNQQETLLGENQELNQELNQEETQLGENLESNEEESQGENTSENNNEEGNTETNTSEEENTEGNNSEENPAEEPSSGEDNTLITTKTTTTTTTTKVTAENTHDVYVTVVHTDYPNEVEDEWKNVINLGDIHESRYEKIIKDLGVGTYIFNVLGTLTGTAYIYKVTPLSMTYDEPTIPEKVAIGQMAMNRDGKYYQIAEDGRWKEFIPASTYEWLCIGTTHINFNDYYTKEEADNLFAKYVNVQNVYGTTVSIDPNIFYKWTSAIDRLQVILKTPQNPNILNEYMLEFKVSGDNFMFECDGIKWSDDEEPEWENGYTYQVSIINGLALGAGWSNDSQ